MERRKEMDGGVEFRGRMLKGAQCHRSTGGLLVSGQQTDRQRHTAELRDPVKQDHRQKVPCKTTSLLEDPWAFSEELQIFPPAVVIGLSRPPDLFVCPYLCSVRRNPK
ncbi:hypothetical protein PFLUV_G00272400 [Perca fluviatilis]|uniref:Uncharacterized protein n=1 Tax=Perca fluviatilis TaxID=8168 RepID=A0A6A5DYZ4_PERFL|nr:hypothetical protein PFLUV_G00272400 [Perca fluviatilis]